MFETVGRYRDPGYALRLGCSAVLVWTAICTGAFTWLGWKLVWWLVHLLQLVLRWMWLQIFPPLLLPAFLLPPVEPVAELAAIEVQEVELGWDDRYDVDEELSIDEPLPEPPPDEPMEQAPLERALRGEAIALLSALSTDGLGGLGTRGSGARISGVGRLEARTDVGAEHSGADPEEDARLHRLVSERAWSCYEEALEADPTLRGRQTWRLDVDDSGRVRSVRKESGALRGMDACVRRKLGRLRFAASARGLHRVTLRFTKG